MSLTEIGNHVRDGVDQVWHYSSWIVRYIMNGNPEGDVRFERDLEPEYKVFWVNEG